MFHASLHGGLAFVFVAASVKMAFTITVWWTLTIPLLIGA